MLLLESYTKKLYTPWTLVALISSPIKVEFIDGLSALGCLIRKTVTTKHVHIYINDDSYLL